MTKREIAIQFGNSLDRDDYSATRSVLADECEYIIGEEILFGPIEISKSYEDNMIEGISASEFYVHFTDYLTHKTKEYIHRCKQRVTVGANNKIVKIEHISDPKEQE